MAGKVLRRPTPGGRRALGNQLRLQSLPCGAWYISVPRKTRSPSKRCQAFPPCSHRENFRLGEICGSQRQLHAEQGAKAGRVWTEEGRRCLLNMQVMDVKKPLVSVARICDTGHAVTFGGDEGSIVHLASGQETRFTGWTLSAR